MRGAVNLHLFSLTNHLQGIELVSPVLLDMLCEHRKNSLAARTIRTTVRLNETADRRVFNKLVDRSGPPLPVLEQHLTPQILAPLGGHLRTRSTAETEVRFHLAIPRKALNVGVLQFAGRTPNRPIDPQQIVERLPHSGRDAGVQFRVSVRHAFEGRPQLDRIGCSRFMQGHAGIELFLFGVPLDLLFHLKQISTRLLPGPRQVALGRSGEHRRPQQPRLAVTHRRERLVERVPDFGRSLTCADSPVRTKGNLARRQRPFTSPDTAS